MTQARKRVSYVLPPPNDPVPRFRLPPHGTTTPGRSGPSLIPYGGHVDSPESVSSKGGRHPRHRLGVASLALDTSTQLAGRSAPEGILYSGGRDGLVMSWDLGIPMKERKPKEETEEEEIELRRPGRRWEIMTGWGDDAFDEDAEDGEEKLTSDGDVLGDVTADFARKRQNAVRNSLPYEHQWETDLGAFKPGTPTQFRQCAQMHTDWVNDILLCNYNQTVVSASSDGTIKSWSPHSTSPQEPSFIGSHDDYVRCLAHGREQNWIASGSFDRTIKLWDLSRSSTKPHSTEPLVTMNPADASAPKSSVYAIAADPFGRTIASGSPERVVRMWDPRSGKRTGKLVGHTDNIRAILISEDSRYLLTGSADASIKLWSLASQRCLHTFTHHTDSVWSLFSSHPSLEIFYSGDRSGLVCKVDVEDCSDVSEGECVVLCQDTAERGTSSVASSDGINKIVAMDDNLLWTATGESTIKRWRVPQRRAVRASALILDSEAHAERSSAAGDFSIAPSLMSYQKRTTNGDSPSETSLPARAHRSSNAPSVQSLNSDSWLPQRDREDESTLYGIPFENLVKLVSANDPFTPYSASARSRDPEVATLYSAASIMSVPRTNLRSPLSSRLNYSYTSPIGTSRTEDTVHPVPAARVEYEEREIAADAVPLYTTPDDVIPGDHGLVRSIILNDRIHALSVDTAGEVAVWDIVRGACLGRYTPDDVCSASQGGGSTVDGGSSVGGETMRSPREALETVRERIEGEAVVAAWATADTKTGVLAIHLNEKSFEAEVYADEVGFPPDRYFNDETKLNIGKWVLRNLFLGFIREEQRAHRHMERSNSRDSRSRSSTSLDMPRRSPKHSAGTTVVSSPKIIPTVPPTILSPRASPLLAPMIPLHLLSKDSHIHLPSIPEPLNSADATPMPLRLRSGTLDGGKSTAQTPGPSKEKEDYFTIRTRQPSIQGGVPSTPDDFSGWSGPGKEAPLPTPVTPGGLMGRLKSFGKLKRPVSDVPSTPSLGSVTSQSEKVANEELATPGPVVTKTPVQILLSNPLNPPTSTEAPTTNLSSNMGLLISEEGVSGFTTVYRGTVGSTAHDMHILEEAMPMWLIEYLLMNKTLSSPPQIKISFVLLPWQGKDAEGGPLPELLNTTQSKLTASRLLRVRKLVIHVQDKLDKMAASSRDGSARSSIDNSNYVSPKVSPQGRAEDLYEILCNDVLLSLDMTLAVVRQYIWRQSTELIMHYRRKTPTSLPNQGYV